MNTLVRLSFVAAVVLAAGCGQNICDRAAGLGDTIIAKADKCPDFKEGFSMTKPTEAEINECKEKVEKCTAQDEEKINEAYDCVDDLAACEAGKEDAFAEAFAACFQKLATVSDACMK